MDVSHRRVAGVPRRDRSNEPLFGPVPAAATATDN
jgi:hypothetical protein